MPGLRSLPEGGAGHEAPTCRRDLSVTQLPRPLERVSPMGPFTVTSAGPPRMAAVMSRLSREKLGEAAAAGLSDDISLCPGGTRLSPRSRPLTAPSGDKPLFRVKEQILPQSRVGKRNFHSRLKTGILFSQFVDFQVENALDSFPEWQEAVTVCSSGN